jgi:hypothetical protein
VRAVATAGVRHPQVPQAAWMTLILLSVVYSVQELPESDNRAICLKQGSPSTHIRALAAESDG